MRRTLPAAAFLLLVAASAFADEYTTETAPRGSLYSNVPENPKSATVPDGYEVVIGTQVDGKEPVAATLPFSFPFFGRNYTTVFVSEDGWLSFDADAEAGVPNALLPSPSGPNALVAPLWDGMRTAKHEVVKFTKGTSPDRVFVVAWQQVLPAGRRHARPVTFEALLHETSGVIEFSYDVGAKGEGWNALTYTSGIEDETGTRAFGAANKLNTNQGAPAHDYRFLPKTSHLTGRVFYERKDVTDQGFSAQASTRPVAGATLEVVRQGTNDVVVSGRTNADGTFDLVVRGLDAVPLLDIDLVSSGAECKVVDPATGKPYRHRITKDEPVPAADTPVGDFTLAESLDSDEPAFRRALCIQQAAQAGYAFATTAILAAQEPAVAKAQSFPQLTIRWAKGTTATTGYTPKTSTTEAFAAINGAGDDADTLDEFVVLREYAQHVFNTIATPPGTLTSHVWDPPLGPGGTVATPDAMAFLDGFSYWFAAVVMRSPKFIDLKPGAAPEVRDLETPGLAAKFPNVAGAIASTLWDLCDDTPGEARDAFAGTLPDTANLVLGTVDQKLGLDAIPAASVAVTIGAFFDEWRAARKVAGEAEASAAAFILDFTLPDDVYEPNDAAGAEAALDQKDSSVFKGLVLNASNEDRYAANLPGEAVVAVSFPEATHVDVQILSAQDDHVVEHVDDASSPAVVKLETEDGAGPFHLRVVWRSGPAAHYTLSIAPQPAISLPTVAWTAGVNYSQTFAVTGAAPPLKYAWTNDVPGLALDATTGRLAGTPTTAGDYTVHVTVTESGGNGPSTSKDIPFIVSPPLELPPFFGIPTKADGPWDVGHGGTGATWTVPPGGDANLPDGFTLAAGSTLQLSGRTDTPTAFTVRGSATDTTGISLNTASTQVVACTHLGEARKAGFEGATDFGYWFDAVASSGVSIEVAFSGKTKPQFLTLIDATGDPVAIPEGALSRRGGVTRLSGLTLPHRSRYFLLFHNADSAAGKASARLRVRPPKRFSRIVAISQSATTYELRLQAVPGSKLRVVVESATSLSQALPIALTGRRPDGSDLALGEPVFDRGSRRATVSGIALGAWGEYVLTFQGSGTGPLLAVAYVTPPAVVPTAPPANTSLSSGN